MSEITEAEVDAALTASVDKRLSTMTNSAAMRFILDAALTARPAPEAGSVVELIRNALQFSVWAAGEGLPPQESHIASPEDFLCDYSTETGDEDWDGIPARVASAIAERNAQKLHTERLKKAIGQAIDILHNNLGRQDEKVRDVEPLIRAALQQEGE